MSFLDDLTNNTKKGNFRQLRRYLEKSDHVINFDKFDAAAYREVWEEAGELQKISDVGKETVHDTYDKLLEDAYYSLFKADPKQLGTDAVLDSALLNHAILERGMDLQEWDELRTYCTLDEWSSAMATIAFSEQLEELAKDLKELFDQAADMAQLEQDLRDALDQMDSIDEMGNMPGGKGGMPGGGGSGGMKKERDALQKHIDKQLQNLLNNNEELREKLKNKGNEIRKKMRDAANNTLDEMKNESDFADAWGTEPGQLQRMSYKERLELGKRVRRSPVLKKLAKLAGRVKRLAMGEQSKKIVHGVDEVFDIEFGNNLGRLVHSEFLALADDELELLFFKKFTEHGLMQYKLRGTEKVGKGPIVVAWDSSGSMGAEDKDGFTREMWAKATALALLDIAKSQNRTFHGICFGSRNEIMEFRFPKGVGTVDQVLDMAEFSFMGGTDFESPLSKAMEVVEQEFNEEGKAKADIIFITDGACNVSQEWLLQYNEAREKTGARVFGIMIGSGGYHYDAGGWDSILQALCDNVTTIEDISSAEETRLMYSVV